MINFKFQKVIVLSALLASRFTFAQEPLQSYQIFLATLSHRSSTAQIKYLSTQPFDQNALLKLLNSTGAEVSGPTGDPKTKKWNSFRLRFVNAPSLNEASEYWESKINKIQTFEIGQANNSAKQSYVVERRLAKIIVERDLLSHYLHSEEYLSLENGRKKLIQFGSNP